MALRENEKIDLSQVPVWLTSCRTSNSYRERDRLTDRLTDSLSNIASDAAFSTNEIWKEHVSHAYGGGVYVSANGSQSLTLVSSSTALPLICLSVCLLRQGLTLNLELTNSARLPGQWASRTHQCLSPHPPYPMPRAEVTDKHNHIQFLCGC